MCKVYKGSIFFVFTSSVVWMIRNFGRERTISTIESIVIILCADIHGAQMMYCILITQAFSLEVRIFVFESIIQTCLDESPRN